MEFRNIGSDIFNTYNVITILEPTVPESESGLRVLNYQQQINALSTRESFPLTTFFVFLDFCLYLLFYSAYLCISVQTF
jgi:hypothetical protein